MAYVNIGILLEQSNYVVYTYPTQMGNMNNRDNALYYVRAEIS